MIPILMQKQMWEAVCVGGWRGGAPAQSQFVGDSHLNHISWASFFWASYIIRFPFLFLAGQVLSICLPPRRIWTKHKVLPTPRAQDNCPTGKRQIPTHYPENVLTQRGETAPAGAGNWEKPPYFRGQSIWPPSRGPLRPCPVLPQWVFC